MINLLLPLFLASAALGAGALGQLESLEARLRATASPEATLAAASRGLDGALPRSVLRVGTVATKAGGSDLTPSDIAADPLSPPTAERRIERDGYFVDRIEPKKGFAYGWLLTQTPARCLLSGAWTAVPGLILGLILAPLALFAGLGTMIADSGGEVTAYDKSPDSPIRIYDLW